MTSQEDIRMWFEMGVERKANYMIVVCDGFSYEDYPVFCETKEEAIYKINNPGSLQRVMESYDLTTSIEDQINLFRASII